MPGPEVRRYFVLTDRGDRGPFDRAGLAEELRDGRIAGDQQVRDAFGRAEGTVAEILARSGGSDRRKRASGPHPLPPVATAPSRGPAIVTILVLVVLVLAAGGLLLLRRSDPGQADHAPPSPPDAALPAPALSTPPQPAPEPPPVPEAEPSRPTVAIAFRDWRVLGPFWTPKAQRVLLRDETPFETGFRTRGDGSVDLHATWAAHPGTDKPLKWKPAKPGREGIIDIDALIGRRDLSIAYLYAECDSPRDGQAELAIGSDDGVQVWVNGEVVHLREIGRGIKVGSDHVTAPLRAGINRILMKIDNYSADTAASLSAVLR